MVDVTTLSNYQAFDLKQGSLHIDVDFPAKVIHGHVTYELTVVEAATSELVLDTSYLKINSVSVNGSDDATFKLRDRVEPLGSALVIDLGHSVLPGETVKVVVEYDSTTDGTALQFLDKEVTDGKKAPYLFSQCQAIHARAMVPCFDTPSVKTPYKLTATSPHQVLMSGRPEKVEKNDDGTSTYFFDQPVPIPLYLLTIASGDIVGAPIGPRSTIYSEPAGIKAAQWEFEADMENFLQIAERLVFAYEWGNYDALVLPSSFPYGGMENPNCTFLTPTLICKDRSSVLVVAHELAHSWSGNLVTLKDWSNFWLNEGWTVYLERRIQEGIAIAEAKREGRPDPEAYGALMRSFHAIIGWNALENLIEALGPDADRYLKLVLDLTSNDDPDDSFSSVPYEKGLSLLVHIEQTLGKKAFDGFIPHYFKKYRYRSVDTKDFLDTLYEYFGDRKADLDGIDWDLWLHQPGLPPKPKFDTTLADECYALAKKWHAATEDGDYSKFSKDDIAQFDPNQLVVFLDTMMAYNTDKWSWSKHSDALKAFEEAYPEYSTTHNAEILFRHYMLQVSAHRSKFMERMGEWLGTVGRMKYVRPAYVLLNKVDHKVAVEYFKKWLHTYHPICRTLVKKDLGL